ncbi:hypothetical protein E3U43_002801 [Larimichthys crocea]|uniref:Uncharacterized protein n=1 Tax=Larimichthys crocea TaxID=215358 RepID=A0ACD3QSU1_LARCR|nr:hypothetical protein E3U43_002801 [Larimichthys crocea]
MYRVMNSIHVNVALRATTQDTSCDIIFCLQATSLLTNHAASYREHYTVDTFDLFLDLAATVCMLPTAISMDGTDRFKTKIPNFQSGKQPNNNIELVRTEADSWFSAFVQTDILNDILDYETKWKITPKMVVQGIHMTEAFDNHFLLNC